MTDISFYLPFNDLCQLEQVEPEVIIEIVEYGIVSPVEGNKTIPVILTDERKNIQDFVDDLDSGIYTKARGGVWHQRSKELINPFLVHDTEKNRQEVLEFFKIISNHY